jgi:nitrogen-specific signal transduction histidine kinase/NAD-dependent dihydropyrimidine dehydrogenase PreA subunit
MTDTKTPLVATRKEKCKVCYTCVRECPAKAIKITKGQAEVIESRCIGCGNCVMVCSQNAKYIRDSRTEFNTLVSGKKSTKIIAMIAPSFPAEFTEVDDHRQFVSMVRKLGFDKVVEVSFGADLIAIDYFKTKKELKNDGYIISTTCPAIVKFIQKYHPWLTSKLAKIVSPMIAMAGVVKKEYGSDSKVVFIGPCLCKKDEAERYAKDKIDIVLTFRELRSIFKDEGIEPGCEMSEFDPPMSYKGSVLALSGGLLQAVEEYEQIRKDDVIVAEGRNDFPDAIREFESGLLKGNHLDLLCCNGCIMGAGMSESGKRFGKIARLSSYVNKKSSDCEEEHKAWIEKYKDIDLSCSYEPDDQRILIESDEEKIRTVLKGMGKMTTDDELNCYACGYDSCREHAIAIIKGLAESEMCLPYTIEQMHGYIKKLGETNEKLADANDALKKSEKLSSMGQMAAGIAHEVNNPLGVVLMYSNLLLDEIEPGSEMYNDIKMIASQADRCKNILSGLLNFARKNELQLKSISFFELFKLVVQSVFVPDDVKIDVSHHDPDRKINLDPDQIVQVFSNLVKNSIEAMRSKGKIYIRTSFSEEKAVFEVEDEGPGISENNIVRLFEPFFTTKEMGKGTGLGLAVSYGIVKMHRGNITVSSNDDPSKGKTGTKFTITLPFSEGSKWSR